MDIIDDVLDLKDSAVDMLAAGRRKARRLVRGESGFSTLVTVLVIMAVGAVIITPLLGLVVTGQRAGRTHNGVTDGLYAADSGIQDGMWRVLNDELPTGMLGTWGGSVYDLVYEYQLEDPVNGCDVSVSVRAVWLLEGLESAKNGRQPHAELVTVGNTMTSGHYKVVVMDNGITGTYKIERIGVWLPAGFEYTVGSSNLEHLATSDPAYLDPAYITVSEWKNGHTVIWDYDASPKKTVNYSDLPAETSSRKIVTFEFTGGYSMSNAFSWVRTNRNDIYLSWSGDLKQFQLEASATDQETGRSTTVVATNMKNEGVASGMAVNGDYAVTGNAIIRDADSDGYYRERLYKETPGTLSGVPDSGSAKKILLYWTGWKDYPLDVWYEHEPDPGEWVSDTYREQLYNLVPNNHLDRVSLTVRIDSGADAGTYLISNSLQAQSWQVVPNAQNDLGVDPWLDPNGWSYSCYADVTELVKTTLRDTYSVDVSDFNGEATYIVGHAQESSALVIDDILQGIWGNSATDIYVVGNSGTIMHYDATTWQTIAVGTTSQNLKDVWCSGSHVWAVGDSRKVGGTTYYTILHSADGGANWTATTKTSGQDLRGIWGSSDANVFAVGKDGDILRSTDGTNWTLQTTPRSETVNGIWGTPGAADVWAVGDRRGSGFTYYYNLWHTSDNGTNWSNTHGSIGSLTGGQNLYSIWGTDRNNVWAVGNRGTILYFNGTSWSAPAYTKPASSTDVTLYGVWGTGGTSYAAGDRVYAVGYRSGGGGGAEVWYYDFDGNVWHDMDCGSDRVLYGVWGSAPDNVYAVGEATSNGTLLRYDGVDDDGDGSLWDPTTGGTQMYGWVDTHSGETVVASTDYPLGDPDSSGGGWGGGSANYQASNCSWSILLIYTDPDTKGHQLYFYDSLRNSGRYETRDFDIEGFLAPSSVLTEDDAARITCFVGEGDNAITGDNIYLNAHLLNTGAASTALASNNVWNSISNSSTGNADGLDLDTFYVSGSSGIIQPGDSEATMTMDTDMDVWSMVFVILSLRSDLSSTGVLSYIVK